MSIESVLSLSISILALAIAFDTRRAAARREREEDVRRSASVVALSRDGLHDVRVFNKGALPIAPCVLCYSWKNGKNEGPHIHKSLAVDAIEPEGFRDVTFPFVVPSLVLVTCRNGQDFSLRDVHFFKLTQSGFDMIEPPQRAGMTPSTSELKALWLKHAVGG